MWLNPGSSRAAQGRQVGCAQHEEPLTDMQELILVAQALGSGAQAAGGKSQLCNFLAQP